MNKGILLVLTGPSGSGKGTILAEYRREHEFYYSVSNTTRAPRPGEIDGVHYHFISKDAFEEKIRGGGMLEYAQYCDNYYGTPRDQAEEQMAAGRSVLLEIEVQGAMQVRKNCPEAVLVFVTPPSMAVLRQRLLGRGTEDLATVEKRLAKAVDEIKSAPLYDFIVINDALDKAVADFGEIMSACKSGDEKRIARLREKSQQLKNTVIREFFA